MRTPSKQKLAAAEVATRMRREIERIERVAREKNFAPARFAAMSSRCASASREGGSKLIRVVAWEKKRPPVLAN